MIIDLNKLSVSWQKASRSNSGSQCVEVAGIDGGILLRDTKDKGAGPVLVLSRGGHAAWLAAAKAGELELG